MACGVGTVITEKKRKKNWGQVHASDRRRHHRAFAWALQHGALPCRAAKVSNWPQGADGLFFFRYHGYTAEGGIFFFVITVTLLKGGYHESCKPRKQQSRLQLPAYSKWSKAWGSQSPRQSCAVGAPGPPPKATYPHVGGDQLWCRKRQPALTAVWRVGGRQVMGPVEPAAGQSVS